MTYTVTSDQGATVRTIAGKRNAERYIRKLIAAGKSYSVETH
jgi:hypothetical protein